MEPSVGGVLVCAALLLLGHLLGSAVVIGLFASLPFGSTAVATLSALGGSSPLIFTAFTLLLLTATAMRKGVLQDLVMIFSNYWTAWVVAGLIVYSIVSAIFFPRLFAGQVVVFVGTTSGVQELPLAPVSGNITQTGYFVISALTFFAVAIFLVRGGRLEILRRGFLTWVILHVCLGLIDLMGKMTGVGDLLSPIRTANYSLLVEVEEAGFWRIAGGYAEASAFGSVTLACLGFSYTYWRTSRSSGMLVLTLGLFALLVFSTSSTAYAGLAIVAPFVAIPMAVSAMRGRLSRPDLLLVALVWIGLTAILCTYLASEHLFDPIIRLFDTMVLNKATSESAQVRLYWNARSMESFLATNGLGVGLGSSRAASWVVAVLSQLGSVGALLMATLVGVLLWDLIAGKPGDDDRTSLALVRGARACVLASLAGASVSSGFADPGLQFFIALAIVVVYRKRAVQHPFRRAAAAMA
jgi:hypothetical protein